MGRKRNKDKKRRAVKIDVKKLICKATDLERLPAERLVSLAQIAVALRICTKVENSVKSTSGIILKIPRRLWRTVPLYISVQLLQQSRFDEFLTPFRFAIIGRHIKILRRLIDRPTVSLTLVEKRLRDENQLRRKLYAARFADIALRSGLSGPSRNKLSESAENFGLDEFGILCSRTTLRGIMNEYWPICTLLHAAFCEQIPALRLDWLLNINDNEQAIVELMHDRLAIREVFNLIDAKSRRLGRHYPQLRMLGDGSSVHDYNPEPLPAGFGEHAR